jgi:hypothetical protein
VFLNSRPPQTFGPLVVQVKRVARTAA